jgi:hypothetical protein
MEEHRLVNLLAGVTLICNYDRARFGRDKPRRYGCRSQTRTHRPTLGRQTHLGSPRFSRLASLASRRGCSYCLPEGLTCPVSRGLGDRRMTFLDHPQDEYASGKGAEVTTITRAV